MRFKLLIALFLCIASVRRADAFLEDLCLPRKNSDGTLSWCVRPNCPRPNQDPNKACPEQTADFVTIEPGRSMVHMDSTYFIAQALGYRADVAYWIAAYDEVTDYNQYVPIDQCGVQAANLYAIDAGTTKQKVPNSGRDFITAQFNGFQRTNLNTDGPFDHYVVNFSPNGQGTDVHGAGGVQSLYPFHYPKPGYPIQIDNTYQKTLFNMRAWAMLKTREPGLLCTVGLTTTKEGVTTCLEGAINSTVPFIEKAQAGVPVSVAAGRKILNYTKPSDGGAPEIVYYEQLESYLNDPRKTTGKLWKSAVPTPVPIQLARIGIYLHALQDTSSHATYCGDDAPSPPGGSDLGTYMYLTNGNQVQVNFGSSCASSPHLASHVQETGTGDQPLPLRVYIALNNTVDELIAFGNEVARHQKGWIVNPELLPPDLTGGKNGQGAGAADIKAALVGTIVSGTPYSRAEVYQSGIITLPLQQTETIDRLAAMNRALADYSATLRKQSPNPARFVPLEHMPGNAADVNDKSVCWKPQSRRMTSGDRGHRGDGPDRRPHGDLHPCVPLEFSARPGDRRHERHDEPGGAGVEMDDGHSGVGARHHVERDLEEAVAEDAEREHHRGGGHAAHHLRSGAEKVERGRREREQRKGHFVETAALIAAGNVVVAPRAAPHVADGDAEKGEDHPAGDHSRPDPVASRGGDHQRNEDEGVPGYREGAGDGEREAGLPLE